MRPLACLALSSLMGLASLPAAAQAFWLCGLSDDATRLVCVADAEPAAPTAADPVPTAVVNGTAFPLDPRRRYVVDLWTVPTDMEFVEQLARATLCHRSPGCQVNVTAPRELAMKAAQRSPRKGA